MPQIRAGRHVIRIDDGIPVRIGSTDEVDALVTSRNEGAAALATT